MVRLRFLPKDFPVGFLESIVKLSGKDLLLLNKNVSEIETPLLANNLTIQDFESWTGYDMIFDYYRLRSADELAVPEIGTERLKQYQMVCEQLEKSNNENFVLWSQIFYKATKGQPSNHFKINLKTNQIERIAS